MKALARLMKYRRRAWQLRFDQSPQFTGARARAWLVVRADYARDQALGHECPNVSEDEPALIA